MPTDLNYPNDPTNNENTILDQQRFSRQDQARMFDPAYVADPLNKPLYMMRFSSAAGQWQRWNGSSWPSIGTLAHDISGNAATASAVAWTGITGKPTTVATSGLTDAVDTGSTQTLTGNKTFSGNTVLNRAGATLVTDYAVDVRQSGSTSNAGRQIWSQNSTYALAMSINSSGGPTAFATLQWIERATGAEQSAPLRLNYNGSVSTPGAMTALSFSGAGTGLTGTASGLSIGGNAATATQATNATSLNGVAGTAGFSVSGAAVSYNAGAGGPTVKGQGGGAAMMTFERPSAYAVNLGLDTDNKLKVGGWSMGAVAHEIYHQGNKPTVSDVTDGRTWQSVTRTSGTSYTNTTGRTIEVAFTAALNTSPGLTVVVGGVTIISLATTNLIVPFSFEVPNGVSYTITAPASLNVAELR